MTDTLTTTVAESAPQSMTSRHRPSLVRLVRTEWLKLRTTRMVWVLSLCAILSIAAITVLVAAISGQSYSNEQVDPPNSPNTLPGIYGIGLSFGFIFSLPLGILGVSSEFRHHTITGTLVAAPRRGRFIASKFLAYTGLGFVLGLLFVGTSVAVGAIVLALRGYSTGLGTETITRTIAISILGVALWTIIGLGLGTLIRNQIVAMTLALAGTTVVEPLVYFGMTQVSYLKDIVQYLPGNATTAMLQADAERYDFPLLPWWGGALTLLGYAVVTTVLGTWAIKRKDIT